VQNGGENIEAVFAIILTRGLIRLTKIKIWVMPDLSRLSLRQYALHHPDVLLHTFHAIPLSTRSIVMPCFLTNCFMY
jgi:hypothetical protein